MRLSSTKWKNGYPLGDNYKSAYAQLDYKWRSHHDRLKRFINLQPQQLICQECGGNGYHKEPILDFGEGPSFPCGFCEGFGFVTPFVRGQWLNIKKKERQFKQKHLNFY